MDPRRVGGRQRMPIHDVAILHGCEYVLIINQTTDRRKRSFGTPHIPTTHAGTGRFRRGCHGRGFDGVAQPLRSATHRWHNRRTTCARHQGLAPHSSSIVMRKDRSRLPPLDLLATFESAAKHLSFTKAGQERFVTQSAISRQIRALEEQLGVALFARRHRALGLTEDGRTAV